MGIKWVLLTIFEFSVPNLRVAAEPVITGVSGSISHDGNVIISGNGFGLRTPPVSRLIFDDARGNSLSDKWDFDCDNGARTSDFRTAYRAPSQIKRANGAVGGPSTIHPRIPKYISGANYGPQTTTCGGKNNQQDYQNTYISYYMRIDPNWNFHTGCTNDPSYCDHNFKEYDWASGFGYMGDGKNIYSGLSNLSDSTNLISFNLIEFGQYFPSIRSWNKSILNVYPDVGTAFSQIDFPSAKNNWLKIEYQLRHRDSINGSYKVWVNNTLTWELYLNDDTAPAGARSETAFGGYNREYGTSEVYKNNWKYYSQVYYDRSWARVILANNSDYRKATIVEPQPVQAWSTTGISIKANLGALGAGATAYLFVFDESGSRSTDGYPVTIVDGSAPSPSLLAPKNLKIL